MRSVPRSQKSNISQKTKSFQQTGAANRQSASETSTNQHKPAKPTRNRVPLPQRLRILEKHVAGKSAVDISKEEHRNRETITKILHGPEMAQYVRTRREEFFALGSDAISAIKHSLTEEHDGRLAFQLLASIGAVPSAEERERLTASPENQETDEDLRVWKIVVGLIQIAAERNCVYGIPDPQLEADLKRVGGKIDEKLQRIVPI